VEANQQHIGRGVVPDKPLAESGRRFKENRLQLVLHPDLVLF
jgi:hypothetical protein